ncbi:hypothetical protein [Hyella patelloides]|nr:hypothetical protein [Hyella patelloides]
MANSNRLMIGIYRRIYKSILEAIPKPQKPNISYINESTDSEDCVRKIRKAITEYEEYLMQLNEARNLKILFIFLFLAFFLIFPIFPIFLVVEPYTVISDYIFILLGFFLPFLLTCIYSSYYWQSQRYIKEAKVRLKNLRIELLDRNLETYEGKKRLIVKRFNDSKSFIKHIHPNPQRLESVQECIDLVQNSIDSCKDKTEEIEKINCLNEADIYLSEIERLLNLEIKDKRQQKGLKIFNIVLIFIYTIGLILVMVHSYHNPDIQDKDIPFFDTPIWALVSGALGSLAAILYKFYTEKRKAAFGQELRWLLARPAIGIVMSIIAYHFFYAGAIFFGDFSGANSANSPNSDEINKGAALMFCFIVSFSDRALEAIIEKLIDTTTRQDDSTDEEQIKLPVADDNSTHEKKEKLPIHSDRI